jgi:hypothetical protein
MPSLSTLGQGNGYNPRFKVDLIPPEPKLLFPPQTCLDGKRHKLPIMDGHDFFKVGQFPIGKKSCPALLWEEFDPRNRIPCQFPIFHSQHEHVSEEGKMSVKGTIAPLSSRFHFGLNATQVFRGNLREKPIPKQQRPTTAIAPLIDNPPVT